MAWNSFSMINIQAFSRKNLVSTSPFLRKLQSKALLNKEAMAVAESIQTHTFEFGELNRKISNGKPTFFFTDLASKLVESKVNDNLKRGYNVRPNDRNITVSQIKTLLSESCPFHVLKLDVKDFFESINRDKLIKSICSEMTVSSETQWLLKKIDRSLSDQGIQGLPRGLSISSTLSELALAKFDDAVRSMHGVYYYSRYVDDILIFCFENSKIILSESKIVLKNLDNLSLNTKKTEIFSVECICESGCNCGKVPCRCRSKCKCKESDGREISLQYLGYKFIFKDTPNGKTTKNVEIDIADKKIKKMKTKIAKVLEAYKKNGDLEIAKKRLKFATGNYPLYKGRSKGGLKGGIYYNYPMLTRNEGLESLDRFKRNISRSMKSPLGRALILTLSKEEVDWISNISHVYGYKNRVFHEFSREELHEIKRCFGP